MHCSASALPASVFMNASQVRPPSKPIIRMNTAASELMSAVMVYWVFFSIGEEKEATQSVVRAFTSSV